MNDECKMLQKLRKDYGVAHRSKDGVKMTTIMTLLTMVEKKTEANQATLSSDEFDDIAIHCQTKAQEAFDGTALNIFSQQAAIYAQYVV